MHSAELVIVLNGLVKKHSVSLILFIEVLLNTQYFSILRELRTQICTYVRRFPDICTRTYVQAINSYPCKMYGFSRNNRPLLLFEYT